VQVERITTGFRGGVAIALDGIHVAEDPAFGTGDFVAADRTYVVLRVLPLLRGRIDIRRIVVRAPRLTIVRTAAGMSVDSLGRRPDAAAAAMPPGAAPAPRPAPSRVPLPAPSPLPGPIPGRGPSTPRAVPALAIALLELEDGVVRYVDRTTPTPVESTIAPLDVRVFDLSLTNAMRVEVDAETAGEAPATVRIRGSVGPVGDPPFAGEVPIEQHVTVHAASLDVADLTVTGRLRRGERGTPIASLRIVAPALRVGDVDLAALDLTANERDGIATLDRLRFQVFGGTVEGSGRVDRSGATPAFAAEAHVHGVDVAQALAARASELAARVEGRLDADASVSGSAGDEAIVRRTLAATGHAVVHDGRLRGVNVADGVLSGVTGVAGLVTLVPSRVRDRYREIFSDDDTRFDELAADVRVADERIVLDSLAVTARDYAVRGTGTVGFDQRVDVAATLVASARLTGDVVGALKEAEVVTDPAGRLAIPFRLTGVLPNVRPQADPEFVARVLRRALVGEGLERLLRGKRDGRRRDGTGRDARDAIERGLGKLLH
jgi:AsmA protein